MRSPKYRIAHKRCVVFLALTILILSAAASGCSKKQDPVPAQTPGAKTPVVTAEPSPTPVPVEPDVVIPSAPVEIKRVTGLSVDKEILNIHIGGSATLLLSVEPSDATRKNVTWSTSNSLVAELSEETNNSVKITGKSAGTVLVTAVSEDGGKMAACIVTVTSSVPETNPDITIEPANPVLTIGSTLKLTAAVHSGGASAKNLTWSSSAPHIAMVSKDGTVSAVGLGTAVITVKSGDGKSASCTVEVRDAEVPVSGITLNMESAILKVGDYLLLTATVMPEDATNKLVNWSSSNESVATVSALGEIRAVGVGSATITAVTSDGNIAATCRIEVEPQEIPIEGIELNAQSQYLKVGGSARLTATVYPEGARMTHLKWESSDSSVVTVSADGELMAKSVGVATVTVSTEDGKYSASCSVIVSR